MTAQIPEKIRYQEQDLDMCSFPLTAYSDLGGNVPLFKPNSSALWRGYLGHWEIVGDRLYMVGLEAKYDDGTAITLETLFPGFPDRVFAHWYSGTLRIPQGKMLQYVHMGYESVFERDVFVTVQRGLVTGTRVRDNAKEKA